MWDLPIGVVALRSSSPSEAHLTRLMSFRLAQYLLANLVDPDVCTGAACSTTCHQACRPAISTSSQAYRGPVRSCATWCCGPWWRMLDTIGILVRKTGRTRRCYLLR